MEQQPAAAAAVDAEPVGRYAGPPARHPFPLTAQARQGKVRTGHLLRALATVATIIASSMLDTAQEEAEAQIQDAYKTGHAHGWHQRGEQLGPEA